MRSPGSSRTGIYGGYSDEQMQKVRVVEQRKAAYVGEYSFQAQLAFTSSQVKNPRETAVTDEIAGSSAPPAPNRLPA